MTDPRIAVVGIILVLMATIRHSVLVYAHATGIQIDLAEGVGLADLGYISFMLLAIDIAVILFAIHGNKRATGIFAFLIGVINLYYFWNHVTFTWWSPEMIRLIPGALYAGMFAYALYFFTEIFTARIERYRYILAAREDAQAWRMKYNQEKSLRKKLEAQPKRVDDAAVELERKYHDQGALLAAAIAEIASLKNLHSRTRQSLRGSKSRSASKRDALPPDEKIKEQVAYLAYEYALDHASE